MRKIIRYFSVVWLVWLSMEAKTKELVIATSFSPETMNYIQKEWEEMHPEHPLRLINRTVSSLERLLSQPNIENVDLVLSSSPFLFQQLQQQHHLVSLPENLQQHQWVPPQLKQTTTAISFSGYGIFYHKTLLAERNLPIPTNWESLFDPRYFNGLLVSSPSRSGSNHIMLEMLLQQKGWEQGWREFLSLSGNLSLISSRSFNVTDKVRSGLAMAGISIDTYAFNQQPHSDVGFVYFPDSIASPTFIAVHRSSEHPEIGMAFIAFLLSDKGQQLVSARHFAKYPLMPLNKDDVLYGEQQKLLNTPRLDYQLLLEREYLVKKLFDEAITFRLVQLKEVWHILNMKEKQLGKKLTILRNELTKMPISETESNDKAFLEKLRNNRNFSLMQERKWAEFFQSQLNKVLLAMEESQ